METTRTEDVRKVVNTAKEQVRTSLLAALGAGSLAGRAVVETVSKAKTRVSSSSDAAKRNVEDLPSELGELRERLDPAELRKTWDEYTDAMVKLYHRLAASGEQTWDEVVEPQVKRGIEQVEEALRAAQQRVDDVTADARERVDEMVRMLMRKGQEGESDGDESASAKTGPTGSIEAARSAREKAMEPGTSTTTTTATARSAREKAMKPGTTATGMTPTGQSDNGSRGKGN